MTYAGPSYIKKPTFFEKKSLDPNSASSTPSRDTRPAPSVPAEIREMILGYFDASMMDTKNQIDAILNNFHKLESSYYDILWRQDYIDTLEKDIINKPSFTFGNAADINKLQLAIEDLSKQQEQHKSLQDKVSKEVSKLIRIKGLREAMITKGFSFAEEYIEHKNNLRLSNHFSKISNIRDMVKQLDSYKA